MDNRKISMHMRRYTDIRLPGYITDHDRMETNRRAGDGEPLLMFLVSLCGWVGAGMCGGKWMQVRI